MPLYVATACVAEAEDGAAALEWLRNRGIERAAATPGRAPGRGWGAAAARWGDRLLLHAACLEAPTAPRWNLAAGDADWRRRSVEGAAETLRRAADGGAPFYTVHAGHALELGLDPAGRPVGAAADRGRALDRLASSLDRLASVADDLRLGLLIENAAGHRAPTGRAAVAPDVRALALFQEPGEIDRLLSRVAAPVLGVHLDVAHLLITCHARKWEPEPVLEELKGWVRAVDLSGTDGRQDLHRVPGEESTEVALVRQAGGLALPVVLEARAVPPRDLLAVVGALEAALAVPASTAS